MTCRHMEGDPECSSGKAPKDRIREANRILAKFGPKIPKTPKTPKVSETPDAERFQIEDAVTVGPHLVMKVRYPNCVKCAYEGVKVMVFKNTSPIQALRWKKIDPHFRDPAEQISIREARSPEARFPASDEGWERALAYAAMLAGIT